MSVYRLPAEIWTACSDLLEDKADLRALSETCQLFCNIFQPRLFDLVEHFQLDILLVTDREELYDQWQKKAISFQERVKWQISQPKYSQYAKTLNFVGVHDRDRRILESRFPKAAEALGELYSAFILALSSFRNIQSVALISMDVDKRIVEGLSNLSLLQEVNLLDTSFSCQQFSPLLTVQTLNINQNQFSIDDQANTMELFSNQRLVSLSLTSKTYIESCLKHFIRQGDSQLLVSVVISVTPENLATTLLFLETCPVLEDLDLEASINNLIRSAQGHRISETALQSLHFYKGPSAIASLIIPNRPVIAAIIVEDETGGYRTDERTVETVLHAISRSSEPVTILAMSWVPIQPGPLQKISKYFPCLKFLQLGFDISDQDLITYYDKARRAYQILKDIGVALDDFVPFQGECLEPSYSLKGLIERICRSELQLPPQIEVLQIDLGPFYTAGIMEFDEESNMVLGLSRLYSDLAKVIFESRADRTWEKSTVDRKWRPSSSYWDRLGERERK